MDGNLYLIKLVKKRPVLWNKTCVGNRDSESRNVAWKEIAAIIGVEIDWIRSRWYNLRERFVKELKLPHGGKQRSNFKYFDEMLFLIKYVEFRKKQNTQFDIVEQLCNKSRPLEEESATEFIITKKEIEEHENIDPDSIFMELECTETSTEICERNADKVDNNSLYLQQICDSTAAPIQHCQKENIAAYSEKIIELPVQSTNNSPEIDPAQVDYKSSSHLGGNRTEKEAIQISSSEIRCEDTIFGELVTAMLRKMDEAKKKNVKKEIINILLS